MSGDTYQIRPGPAQQLTGAPQGAGLFSNNDINSVWIGSSPTVSPGNGQLLNPQGTASWTSKTSCVYACVDTGVNVPVTITFSEDFDSVTDPVAAGAAIAAKLALTGVPNVLFEEQVANDTVYAGQGKQYDISKYSSIAVVANNSGAGVGAQNGPLYLYFSDVSMNSLYSEIMPLTGNPRTYMFSTLMASKVSLYNPGFGSPPPIGSYNMTGSNRQLLRRVETRSNNATGTRVVQASQALVAGTPYLLFGGFFQGFAMVRFALSSGTACQGFWYYVDEINNQNFLLCASSELIATAGIAGLNILKQVIFPAGFVNIYFQPTTSGTTLVATEITPEP